MERRERMKKRIIRKLIEVVAVMMALVGIGSMGEASNLLNFVFGLACTMTGFAIIRVMYDEYFVKQSKRNHRVNDASYPSYLHR